VKMTLDPVIRDRVRGCLAGAVLGDILGRPAAGLTPEELIRKTGGRGIGNPFMAQYGPSTVGTGSPTNNTIALLAVAESIIEQEGVDHQKIAEIIREHYPERESGDNTAIKVLAPVLMYRVLRGEYDEAVEDTKAINTRCGFGRASAAGCVSFSAAVMWPLMVGAINCCDQDNTADMLATAISRSMSTEYEQGNIFPGGNAVTRGLIKITELIDQDVSCWSARSIIGTGNSIAESLPFSLMMFIHHHHEFEHSVLEAANAGGDAPGNALLVGALVGANGGAELIPKKWRNQFSEAERAREMADKIIAVASRDNIPA